MQSASTRRRATSSSRRPVLATAAVVAAAVIAACGGSGKQAGARVSASAGDDQALRYSNCMRASGVPNFPDPGAGGGVELTPSLNPQSPSFEQAQQACAKLQPGGNGPPPTMTETQRLLALKLATCIRRHGIASFPDPGAGPRTLMIRGMEFPNVTPALLFSPAFHQAATDCGLKLPSVRRSS
jgi:hypothetical protein